jgi:thiol:disulfide interchange protein
MTRQPSNKLPLWPLIIKVSILLLAILIIAIFTKNPKAKPEKGGGAERLEVQKETGQPDRFTLGKFYTADWCIYCQKLKKVLDDNPETKDWQEIIEIVDMTHGDENFSESMPVIFPIINGKENRSIKLLSGYSEKMKSAEYFIDFLKKALKLRKEVLATHEDLPEKEASEARWQKFSTSYFYRSSLYSDCLIKREAVLYATTPESKKTAKEAYESALEQYAAAEKKKDIEAASDGPDKSRKD